MSGPSQAVVCIINIGPRERRRRLISGVVFLGLALAALATAREDATPELTSAIERCLEPSPAARPASAASLQVMFEESLQGRRVDLSRWLAGLFPEGRAGLQGQPTVTVPRSEAPTLPQRKPPAIQGR